jgi:ubiquinone biosynthesis protein
MKHLAHLSRIAFTVSAHGFAPLVAELGVQELIRLLPKGSRFGQPRAKTWGKRLRLLFEELGPTFQKFGQILSTQSDLLPAETIQELQKLQHDLPPMSFKDVQAILRRELGTLDRFVQFDDKPFAVATIGQLHRATLPGGTQVAVKIQRKGIAEQMTRDVDALQWIANTVVRHKPQWKRYNIVGIVALFRRSLLAELNLKEEASNYRRLSSLCNRFSVRVPKIYPKLCTGQVLTLEWIDGEPLTTVLQTEQPSELKKKIAEQVLNLVLHQIFHEGTFHGDPHPGNFLIDDEERLTMIDVGLVGTLTTRHRTALIRAMRAVLSADSGKMASALSHMCDRPPRMTTAAKAALSQSLSKIFEELREKKELEKCLNRVFRAAAQHDLIIDVNYVLMLKALLTVESMCRQLSPEVRIMTVAKPIIMKGLLRWTNPFRMIFNR